MFYLNLIFYLERNINKLLIHSVKMTRCPKGRQGDFLHSTKVFEAERKEMSAIKGIVRAVNEGNYARAGALIEDYKENYPRSNIWTASRMDNVTSGLEEAIHTNTPVSVTISGNDVRVESNEELNIVRPYEQKRKYKRKRSDRKNQ